MKRRDMLVVLVLSCATGATLAHGPGAVKPAGGWGTPPGPPKPPDGHISDWVKPPNGSGATSGSDKAGGGPVSGGRKGQAPRTGQSAQAGAGAGGQAGSRGGAISGSLDALSSGPNDWELWWHHNKSAYVMQRAGVRRTTSGSSGALTSRGRRTVAANNELDALRPQIIDVLREVLERERDPELCDSATLALGRVSAADLAQLVDADIRKGLQHDVLSVSTSATLSLGVLGANRSLPLLNALMADTSAGRAALGGGAVPWNVRAYAALSLGLINEPLAVEPLLDVARHSPASDREVRAAAVTALGLMQSEDPAQIVVGLLDLVRDEKLDPVVRACAVTALGRLGDSTALPTLLKLFKAGSSEQVVQQSLAQSLGMLGSLRQQESVAALASSVDKESDASTRQFAWISLGRLGAAGSGDDLAKVRSNLVALMIEGLVAPKQQSDRAWVALAAGLFGSGQPDAAQALVGPLTVAYAKEKDPSMKSACALALGLCGADGQAPTFVADLAASSDAALRGYLAVALGLLGHEDAGPALLELCREKSISHSVRQQVASSLAMLGVPAAAPALLEELATTDSLEYASSMSRALGELRDPRSIGPLMAMARDPQGRVVSRAFACVALGLIGDKLDLRFNTRIEQDYNYLAGATTIDEIVGL